MTFHEVQFPTGIAYGALGGPAFKTSVIQTDSGAEERVSRWDQPLYRYDVGHGVKDLTDIRDVLEFFIARQGATAGFRFKDWTDYSSDATHDQTGSTPDDEDVEIGVGNGAQVAFQLIKNYTSGSITRTRNITKPVDGTVVVAVDGVAQTVSTDYTIDHTSGVITFNTAPGSGLSVTAGFDFDVPVRFGQGIDSNGLRARIDSFESGSISGIELVEIRSGLTAPGEFFFGGTHEIANLVTDTDISLALGRVVRVAACDGTAKLMLPDTALLQPGGPYFYIHNLDASNTIEVEDEDGNTVATVGTSSTTTIILAAQDAQLPSQTWYTSGTDDGAVHVLDGSTTNEAMLAYLTEQPEDELENGPIGAFNTEEIIFTSEAGLPNVLEWQSGAFTFHWDVADAPTSSLQLQSSVYRVSADLTTIVQSQASSALTNMTIGAGTYTDVTPSYTWSTSGTDITDRIVFRFSNRSNSGSGSPRVDLTVGGATNCRVVGPVIDQPTLFKWIGF